MDLVGDAVVFPAQPQIQRQLLCQLDVVLGKGVERADAYPGSGGQRGLRSLSRSSREKRRQSAKRQNSPSASIEVIIPEPPEFRAELEGLLAANPGDGIGVLEGRVASSLRKSVFSAKPERSARDVDVRKHSGQRGNPKRGGVVFIVRDEIDADAIQAGPEFVGQGWPKNVGLPKRQQVALGRPEVAEPGQVVPLHGYFRPAVVVRNEVAEQPVVRGNVVIDAARELVELAAAGRGANEIRAGGVVGMRHQRHQFLRDRIGDGAALGIGRNRSLQRGHLSSLPALVAGEEEGAITHNRPAHAVAENIALEGGNGSGPGVKIVFGVELFVAHEFEGGAVDAV